MINGSKHIIEKIHLEFNTPSEVHGKFLEMQTSELFRQKLLPKMERLFDQLGDDKNIRLDNLSLEIEVKDSKHFEEQFINQFLDQLSQKLENAPKSQSESKAKTEDLFLYFLENGFFPWWTKELSVEVLEKQLLQKKKIPFSIPKVLENNQKKLKRLVFQFSDKLLQTIVNQHFENKSDLNDFIQKMQLVLSKSFQQSVVRNQLWIFSFEAIFNKKLSFEHTKSAIFKSLIDHFSNAQKSGEISIEEKKELADNILKELKNIDEPLTLKLQAGTQSIKDKRIFSKPEDEYPNKSKTKTEHTTEQKEWYVNNAGLVLLHPFFVLFFEGLGLTKENVFTDEHAQNQAALILQYLATGKKQSFEDELILIKILCEIPFSMPVEKDLILSEKIKTEAGQLLNAVIKHWAALKNTTPDGLRNTFLQREGKLTKNIDGSWKLYIQQNSFDILISKLPWSISIIKLPWMKNMLQVEWA